MSKHMLKADYVNEEEKLEAYIKFIYERDGDFRKGQVYIIECQDKVYIGSTIKSLDEVFKEHKSVSNKSTSKILFELGEPTIKLLEAFSCDNKSELLKRESEIMLDYPNRVNRFNKHILGN